jgi:hypothetical protein
MINSGLSGTGTTMPSASWRRSASRGSWGMHGGPVGGPGLGPATEDALMSLLALNGLRVSEAVGADTEQLGAQKCRSRAWGGEWIP